MKITAIRTPKVLPGKMSLEALLEGAIPTLAERSIVVVTSKVVSLCENRVVPMATADREQLIRDQAELYVVPDAPDGEYRYNFTITKDTLIPASGIDASNGNGDYILWPDDPIDSANQIRRYLTTRFGLAEVGVIITDSTIGLSRWGTLGIAIGHSGFSAIKDYIGQPDLFGRLLSVSKANIAGGLAAAAVVVMGEGAEQTPVALIEDVGGVEFHDRDTTPEEIKAYYVSPLNDDPFKPFFGAVQWQRGGKYRG